MRLSCVINDLVCVTLGSHALNACRRVGQVDDVTGLYVNVNRQLSVGRRFDAVDSERVLRGVEADVIRLRIQQFDQPGRGSHRAGGDGFAHPSSSKHLYMDFAQFP